MQIPKDSSQPNALQPTSDISADDLALKAIAYSMDALIPGLYLWCGPLKVRLGGSRAEASYPGTIHSAVGFAVVLPGYRIYGTYQDSYDPR